jgi:hypothetical protein
MPSKPRAPAIESTGTHPAHLISEHGHVLLERLRGLIARWPETTVKLSHGAPTWWGGKKTFACYHDGAYDQGRPAVWIKAAPGAQEALIDADPDRFYRPKYVGPSGWVGLRLDGDVDWSLVETLLLDGYRSVAPEKALEALVVGVTSDERKPRKKAAAKSATKQSVAKKAASKSAKGPRHKRS